LDSTHLPFVHDGVLGDKARPEVNDYDVHEREGGGLISDPVRMYQTDWDGSGNGGDVPYTFEILNPWTMLFRKGEEWPGKVFWCTVQPIAEAKSRLYLMAVQNTDRPTPEESRAFWDTVLAQDKHIIEKQRPELLPLDLQQELHLKSDRLHIAYRQWLTKMGLTVGVE
jgi:phenylpropionate dioxygenase-like ring-hydroxylating dioxygenase large terminal subunit